MKESEIFMKGYLNRGIKITFLDNLSVIGMYLDYYYFNNVIVIMPKEAHDDTRLLIPMSAIKTIGPWDLNEYDYLEDEGIILQKEDR
ncbi:hypothetical protein [Paenibacillus bovis]|uniref:PRC-barrel domain-containing protein n=1 Tax=Paenibacillus bovis TaxID=1616788 RepID=A0A172ZB98_9BACL|nr:hypothetical protein [Paenibacillus bovis]ANF94898.1 hypothetical protein AR543_01860 [Paenibacillus bovis]